MAVDRLCVVHVAQSDSEGGANKAAFRLHSNLQKAGFKSIFHCGRRHLNDPSIVPAHSLGVGDFVSDIVAYFNARSLKQYQDRKGTPFSPMRISYGRLDSRLLSRADVVCLHWVAGGFLNAPQLQAVKGPLVWRLSDIWPFSGGCHYPGNCTKFEGICGSCPQLGSASDDDLSRSGMRLREVGYRNLDLTVVAPSRWIADLARRSHLFGRLRIEHIPTGVDLEVFRPEDRVAARARLNLPAEGHIIAFGALGATSDPRKGYAQLRAALEKLAASSDHQCTLVTFGGNEIRRREQIARFPVCHLGRIDGQNALANVYSAADILAAPFLEDNLPNVVLESIACGTPVAAFAAGGIPDAVEHEINGHLSPIGDTDGLAQGIAFLLDRAGDGQMRRAAQARANDQFDIRTCARRYGSLFEEIVADRRARIDKITE
ncbi:glycosyltransferase [Bradyrhizobium sp. WYCCWR 13023]|uniref:Glycosyltransferase n=1 Tax=Bradyrhizobium zhengyangense TaxID=2911009 RepID=A0A9X1RDE4_9BRAD|nr:glycosyltransferase [Bradyrhizobium zhengyangense]MCG2630709.1 glycosyltransferase [Bradyrhizobium zhengyangense]